MHFPPGPGSTHEQAAGHTDATKDEDPAVADPERVAGEAGGGKKVRRKKKEVKKLPEVGGDERNKMFAELDGEGQAAKGSRRKPGTPPEKKAVKEKKEKPAKEPVRGTTAKGAAAAGGAAASSSRDLARAGLDVHCGLCGRSARTTPWAKYNRFLADGTPVDPVDDICRQCMGIAEDTKGSLDDLRAEKAEGETAFKQRWGRMRMLDADPTERKGLTSKKVEKKEFSGYYIKMSAGYWPREWAEAQAGNVSLEALQKLGCKSMKPTGFKSKMMRGLAFPRKGKPPFKLVYIAGVMHEKGDELVALTKNLMANHGQKIYVNAMKGAPALPFLNSWKEVRKASSMIWQSDAEKARILEKEEKKKQKMLADAEKEGQAWYYDVSHGGCFIKFVYGDTDLCVNALGGKHFEDGELAWVFVALGNLVYDVNLKVVRQNELQKGNFWAPVASIDPA